MQKIEEKQRHERTAIRVLLNDLKVMTEEKDLVVKEKCKLEMDVSSLQSSLLQSLQIFSQIEQLKTKLSEEEDKFASLSKNSAIKIEEVKELRKQLDRQEKLQKQLKDKLDSQSTKYDYNLKQLKKLIEQVSEGIKFQITLFNKAICS